MEVEELKTGSQDDGDEHCTRVNDGEVFWMKVGSVEAHKRD